MSKELILSTLPLTNADIKEMATEIVVAIADGEVSALKVAQQVSAMEKIVKAVKEDAVYKRVVLSEAEKEDSKTFGKFGAQFQVKEVGVKYDYSNCGDAVYNALQDELKDLQSRIKQREEMLKGMPKDGTLVVNEDTGEMYTIYPPVKSSTTSVSVTIK